MSTDNTVPLIQGFPPEVLQLIWRHNDCLDFFDLLSCQQVCRYWRSYLPGNDPELRSALYCSSAQGSKRSVELHVCIRIHQKLSLRRGKLPRLEFELSLTTHGEKDTFPHPIIQGTTRKYDLSYVIHPALEPRREPNSVINGSRRSSIRFLNFGGLKRLKERPKNTGGSWEQMLATKEPHQEIELVVSWISDHEGFDEDDLAFDAYYLENTKGVTLKQCVEAIRDSLSQAEKIKNFAHTLDQIEDYTHNTEFV